MDTKTENRIISLVRQDSKLKPGEKIIVCLNRAYTSMLDNAYLLPIEGRLQPLCCETYTDGAIIRMSEGDDGLVAFHESRENSQTHRPNGIRVHHKDLNFPCVVFYNIGEEALTVDGTKVQPGSYVAVPEMSMDDPEVKRAMDKFLASPEVRRSVRQAQLDYAEKERALRKEQSRE